MADDPEKSRRANRIAWLAICIFVLCWVAPLGFVTAYPPQGTPTRGEMALIGVFEIIKLLAALGLLGTGISVALAIWSLRLKRQSVVAWVALALDIVATVSVLSFWVYFQHH